MEKYVINNLYLLASQPQTIAFTQIYKSDIKKWKKASDLKKLKLKLFEKIFLFLSSLLPRSKPIINLFLIQTNWWSSFSKRHMMSHMVQMGFNFEWYLCRNYVNESILVGHWYWCEFESSNVDRFNTFESAKQQSYIRSPSRSYIVSSWRKYSFWDSSKSYIRK